MGDGGWFEWNEDNEGHVLDHDVDPAEVEATMLDLGDEFWENAEPITDDELPPPRPKAKPRPRKGVVSVRMENDLVNRLKVLASIKGVGYQTLLRQFVAERIYEEEKREGIIEK